MKLVERCGDQKVSQTVREVMTLLKGVDVRGENSNCVHGMATRLALTGNNVLAQ